MQPRRMRGLFAGRAGTWGLGGGGAVLVLLMLWTPTAAAGPAAISYSAPYHHALITDTTDYLNETGCAKETARPTVFDPAKGVGSWAGTASARSCKGSIGKSILTSEAVSDRAVMMTIPLKVPAGTATGVTIAVTWNISVKLDASMSYHGTCPAPTVTPNTSFAYTSCVEQYAAEVIGGAYVVDLTTGAVSFPGGLTPTLPGIYDYYDDIVYCSPNCTTFNFSYPGGKAFSGPDTLTWNISMTTDHADQYALATWMGGEVACEISYVTGHSSGYVNMATGGNGFRLVSITET